MRIALLATTALLSAAPALAQSKPQSTGPSNVEGRVGRLESEMRAVQRKVFPGGAGQYLQPQVEAASTAGPIPGSPATGAVADLSSRVSALESQLSGMTGQIEQAGYRSKQVQEQFDAYRRATDARLKALEAGGAPAAGSVSTAVDTEQPDTASSTNLAATPRATTTRSSTTLTRPTASTTPAKATAPAADLGHSAKLTAITKPDSGDAAEDAYTYGYRLWSAKLYPEAQAALKKAATDYPKARRYSFSQNLLGRAYLDDGKPSLASMAFYDNYKKMPDGERAPESLFYLAQALQKLNKPADACKVYDELGDVYAAKIGAKMKADVAAGRATAKCKAS